MGLERFRLSKPDPPENSLVKRRWLGWRIWEQMHKTRKHRQHT
jgi:hypothetical protein